MSAFRWFDWAMGPSADPDLTPLAKIVAWLLAKHADNATGRCYPSQALLAKESGSSVSGVRKATDALEAAGWISCVPGRGRTSSYYRLVVPECPEKGGQTAPSGAGRATSSGQADRPERGMGTTQRTSPRTSTALNDDLRAVDPERPAQDETGSDRGKDGPRVGSTADFDRELEVAFAAVADDLFMDEDSTREDVDWWVVSWIDDRPYLDGHRAALVEALLGRLGAGEVAAVEGGPDAAVDVEGGAV
jgi:hypothetical protein